MEQQKSIMLFLFTKKNFFKSVRSETINLKLEKSFWPHTHTHKRHFLAYTLSENKYTHPLIIVKLKVAQSHSTLCDPMDHTVPGILQARTLEWVAFPFSRGSYQPRDGTRVSHIASRHFTIWTTVSRICNFLVATLQRGQKK